MVQIPEYAISFCNFASAVISEKVCEYFIAAGDIAYQVLSREHLQLLLLMDPVVGAVGQLNGSSPLEPGAS